jgi:hypothetical protein
MAGRLREYSSRPAREGIGCYRPLPRRELMLIILLILSIPAVLIPRILVIALILGIVLILGIALILGSSRPNLDNA